MFLPHSVFAQNFFHARVRVSEDNKKTQRKNTRNSRVSINVKAESRIISRSGAIACDRRIKGSFEEASRNSDGRGLFLSTRDNLVTRAIRLIENDASLPCRAESAQISSSRSIATISSVSVMRARDLSARSDVRSARFLSFRFLIEARNKRELIRKFAREVNVIFY